MAHPPALSLVALLLILSGCAVGPDYVRPPVAAPVAYKESGDWLAAQPQVVDAKEAWWRRYGDADLDVLVERANMANQSLQVAQAQYRQARAATQVARSAYSPTLGADANFGRARTQSAGGTNDNNVRSLALDASWEPDIWGRVSRAVEAGEASEQASAADLAAVRLSLQAELVQDYVQLRITDVQKDLLVRTVAAYTKALALTRSQYGAGVATKADVALAETQLESTRAQAIDLEVQRAQLEHALAILSGRPPAEVTIVPRAQGALGLTLPTVPAGGLPSQLLERRPDIAGAERRAAAANAGIGIAQAAYFPNLTLSATGGNNATSVAQLFDAPARIWSLGAGLAGTIFDGGARNAQKAQAQAVYDAAAAQYKQTVLAGLQDVEDNLVALRVLAQESGVQDAAVAAAGVAERASLAQYRAGTATYLTVVTAQTLSLSNQRAAIQLLGRQLAAHAALVKALGGGWSAAEISPQTLSSASTGASVTAHP